MTRVSVVLQVVLVIGFACVAFDVLAQTTSPVQSLVDTAEDSIEWLLVAAAAIGALVGVVGGIFCYMGWLPREWLMKVIVIAVLIALIPQIIQFIYDMIS